MASTEDYRGAATIAATSPDQRIYARIRNDVDLEIWFQPYVFDRYDEGELAYQLGRLGQLTWVAYRRARDEAYQQALRLSGDEFAGSRRPPEDARRRSYHEAVNEVAGEGVSPDGSVRIYTVGMLQWRVEIEYGAPRRLGEDAFVAQLGAAYRALLADRDMKIAILKSEHFDLGIPRKWLEAMRQLQAINRQRRARGY